MGKTPDSRVSYALGFFDNRFIAAGQQDVPMVVGRLDFNLASTKDVFQDAHFGADRWYSFGINGSVQNRIENVAGATDSSNTAAGVDGMVDVPFGKSRVFVKGELNAIRTELHATDRQNNCTVKMIGLGILPRERIQPFVRFDQVRGDSWGRSGRQDITFVGANFYQRGHGLKIQGDLRMQAGTQDAIDGVRLQAQTDF